MKVSDIIYVENRTVYLIHVKYGFDSKMRELSNQILISARRLKELVGTGERDFFERIHTQLGAKDRLPDKMDAANFISLFRRKVVYVLAFTSQLRDDLEVQTNIDRYPSNITRFSLMQCSSEIRADYYELLTYQILRTQRSMESS